jgi:hypothetical protein
VILLPSAKPQKTKSPFWSSDRVAEASRGEVNNMARKALKSIVPRGAPNPCWPVAGIVQHYV